MTYRPAKEGQIDGTSFEQQNCMAAGTTMLIDRATVGRVRTSSATVRRKSGVLVRRGLYLSECINVADQFGVTLEQRRFAPDGTQRGKLRDLVASGRGVIVLIDCSVTVNTEFRTNGFTGTHAIVLNEYGWRDVEKPHAVFVAEDPGTTAAGWLEWPADLVYRAAEAYLDGAIYTLATRDTEGVTRRCREVARIRSKPSVGSTAVGRLVLKQSYPVQRTVNGGPWKRADGTAGNGWHQVGADKYTKGEALQ